MPLSSEKQGFHTLLVTHARTPCFFSIFISYILKHICAVTNVVYYTNITSSLAILRMQLIASTVIQDN